MRLKVALDRMMLNNNELAKSLFALKTRQLAGITTDLTKSSPEKDQTMKKQREKHEQHHLHIPGYFPLTPTILQVRKPQENTYLHYGL